MRRTRTTPELLASLFAHDCRSSQPLHPSRVFVQELFKLHHGRRGDRDIFVAPTSSARGQVQALMRQVANAFAASVLITSTLPVRRVQSAAELGVQA